MKIIGCSLRTLRAIPLRSLRFRLLVIAPFLSASSFSQNLIPNPGFEGHEKCQGLNTQVSIWKMPTDKYYHYLSDCPAGKAQYSGEENNAPYAGKALAGICLYPGEMREYITVPLNEKLKAGEVYVFSGYISLAAEKHNDYKDFSEFEVAFTSKEYSVTKPRYIFIDPQVRIPISFENKEMEWIYMSGRFTAKGGETYLLMGDFLSESPISAEMDQYMALSAEEKEKYLKKNTSFAADLNEFNSYLANTSASYSVRCYLDELCLMRASDTLKGLCNYPIRKPEPKIQPAKPIVIKNIFFETSRSNLLPASFRELDSLASWLKNSPSVEIQITGHTDNRGNEKENNKLSSDRAASVKNYLRSNGATNKIGSEGMGSSQPEASNETEEGRSRNRRVEFIIIKQ